MEKEAWVVGIEGDQVRLRYLRHSFCRDCGACSMFGEGEQEVLLPNSSKLNLQVGDRVAVEMKSGLFLRASLLAYGVPLLFFLLGYLVGENLSRMWWLPGYEEAGGIIGGLIFLFLSYKGINLYDRRLQTSDRYQLQITRVLNRGARKE